MPPSHDENLSFHYASVVRCLPHWASWYGSFKLLPQHGLKPAGKQLRRGCLICKKFGKLLFNEEFPQKSGDDPLPTDVGPGVFQPPTKWAPQVVKWNIQPILYRWGGRSPRTSDDGPAQRQVGNGSIKHRGTVPSVTFQVSRWCKWMVFFGESMGDNSWTSRIEVQDNDTSIDPKQCK